MNKADKTPKEQQKKKVPGVPFTKNDPRINKEGRPLGSVGFKTLFKQAIKKIAKTEDIKECDIEVDMIIKAIAEANKGNYQFYRDIFDRNYGRAKESLDVTSGGEKIYTWDYGSKPKKDK